MKKKNFNFIISITCVLLAIITFRYYSQVRDNKVERIKTEVPKVAVKSSEDASALPLPTPKEEEPPKKEPSSNMVTFSNPSDGQIIQSYVDDKLIYFEELGDWRAHEAIDYSGSGKVYAVSDGKVENVFNDNLYGLTIKITHTNDYASFYASLSSAEVEEGDTIKGGQIIGKSGNSAVAEKNLGDHLHFYMEVENKRINPLNG